MGKAWEYTYDPGGNILSKTERSYSGGNIGAAVSTHTYGYDDETWPDLLTEYDGDTITYDEIGNPERFLGWDMTWKGGRQLACMAQGDDTIQFDYNESGLRTSKIVTGQETEYIWSGDRLVAEIAPNHSFCFHYDTAGEMIGYTYRPASGTGAECLLVKNLQGDVERVVSDTGSLLASYTYDAWGNLCQSSGSLAAINPIRYRSYYFDSETGLYYLQSRYYSPQVGRFVNADGLIDTDAGSTGCNLYAYAANRPVIAMDSTGNSAVVIVCAVAGACAGGYTGYRIAEANGYTGWKKAGAIAGGALTGSVLGGIGGYCYNSVIAPALASTVSSLSPDIGNKIDYMFGCVSGSMHNITRTQELKNTLISIGINDDANGRSIVTTALYDAYSYVSQGIVNAQTGRVTVDSLLAGPNGFLVMKTIWDENHLITVYLVK